MNPRQILARLISEGVFEPRSGEEDVQLSSKFRESTKEVRAIVDNAETDGIDALLADVADDPDVRANLRSVVGDDPELLVSYLALSDFVEELTHLQTLRVALVTRQMTAEPPRSEGAPEWFLPIDGENLGIVSSLYDRCIVFIWREECPPCDIVREDFDELFANGPPEDLLLVSVYGPACADYLEAEFDVVGGPTTLFVLHGRVDARLQGASGRAVLEKEIQKIRERTVEPA